MRASIIGKRDLFLAPGPFEAFAATALAVVRSKLCTGEKTPAVPLRGAAGWWQHLKMMGFPIRNLIFLKG